MTRISGISDEINVLDSTDTDITADLGHIMGFSYGIDEQAKPYPSMGAGASYQEIIDDFAIVSCGLVINPLTFKALKLIGTVTGTTTWTFTLDDVLPEFDIKANIDGSYHAHVVDAKFGTCSIRVNKGNPVELVFDGLAKELKTVSGAITNTPPATARMFYLDGYLKIDSDVIGSVDNITIDINRGLEATRGVEQTTAGNKRKPSELIEKMKDITFSMTVEITDTKAYEKHFGTATYPLTIQDSRSSLSLYLVFEGEQGTITLTGAKTQTLNHDRNADGEIRTVELKGLALGMSAANTT